MLIEILIGILAVITSIALVGYRVDLAATRVNITLN
jgi:hypothetical protein